MDETWKSVPGFEGIAEASSLGRIRSVERKILRKDGRIRTVPSKVLNLHIDKGGRATVGLLIQSGKTISFMAAAIVLSAFACPRPPDMIVGYRDGDKTNLKPSNLFWQPKECVAKKNTEDPTEQQILGMAEQIRRSWSEEECRRREVNPRPRWQLPVVSSEWIPRKVMDQIESINRGDQYSSKSEALG